MEPDFLNNKIILEDMESIYHSRNEWNELSNASIYISGATGMLASYIVMFLIYLNETHNQNISIYAGIRTMEKAQRIFGSYVGRSYIHLIVSDITQPFSIDTRLDYMIHAASLASPQYYGSSPVETMLPNIVGTNELLKWCRSHPVKSFLFFSSGAVYGSFHDKQDISESDVGTLDFLADGNVYGESKRCGEALCRAYYKEYGIPVKSVRISHTYSPTMDIHNDKRAFSEFVSNIVNGENIVLKSDGKAKRAFCYITDAITALFLILFQGKNGDSYNMGNNNEFVSIGELAEQLVALFPEKKLSVSLGKRCDSGYKSIPENQSVIPNTNKLNELGWYPKTTIKEGFYRTICYLEQKK
jgi:nucleoside-diphosphate-sugar epimerase